jgi:hypothetical protein
MDLDDSQIRLDEERRLGVKATMQKFIMRSGSKPRAFRNDPDDPNNPNEVRERYLQKIRSLRAF